MTSCTLPLLEVLNDSISSGRFADTKIILYSRRDSTTGTIFKPKALYASRHVLKSVPYFSDLLSGGFAESKSKDFSEPVDEDEQAEDYGYYSDSDLEDDIDDAGEALEETTPLRGGSYYHFCLPTNSQKPVQTDGEWEGPSGKGAVIKICDIAFITFRAFLIYLYTGHIEFAPYGSDANRRSRSTEVVSLSKDSIPRPSPKSIYRLADKYDILPLKTLALNNIRDGLERCDTVEEVFSEFSSRHQEVRIMHANHLTSVLSRANEESAQDLWDQIEEKIDCYINGDLDHAVDAVILLWKLSKGYANCSIDTAGV
ncbi:hypothetical protein BJ322DRAFT_827251 [Thelephora terrestris]|uniref:BTB domain-containing protein n=1 Tax=Thelephora terrestris TaxID=56493 RepID=A0A9P6HGE1_9AGAM|nr:hypothetical protein BJ322DRAFT_827251 [Thelephora terrestris]